MLKHEEPVNGRALRFGDPPVQALLGALVVFRPLPNWFADRDLREHLARSPR